ncbi:MAG: class I SAM-dependent methyltransferase [Acidobacteria bacterium]|nr:class I SAM-dependent methyltransferase [Acidobacteriota bacterium]
MDASLNPGRLFGMMTAYQQTAALKAAVDVDLFTAIGEGVNTASALAARCNASERGLRILADYLTVQCLLTKQGDQYSLTAESGAFLNRHSPAYVGAMSRFLAGPQILAQFGTLTEAVRKGGVASDARGATADQYGGWVDFAHAMEAMMGLAAMQIAGMVNGPEPGPLQVLDVAASHGLFGFQIAKQNPAAHITALDWPNVLEITQANAARWGLTSQVSTIAGDAFQVDLGGPYDVILLTNLLHHFDFAANVALLKRMKAALKPGGRVFTLEFVPNEDRVSPPGSAVFPLVMLASTPAGDAYTFSQLSSMFSEAGFAKSEQFPVIPTPETVIISQ